MTENCVTDGFTDDTTADPVVETDQSTMLLLNDTKATQATVAVPKGPRPTRPLSAYNLFFRVERTRILNEEDNTFLSPHHIVMLIESTSVQKEKRKHKKSHGKISFIGLARVIADRWNNLDHQLKVIFESIAGQKKAIYKKQLKAWKAGKEIPNLEHLNMKIKNPSWLKTTAQIQSTPDSTVGATESKNCEMKTDHHLEPSSLLSVFDQNNIVALDVVSSNPFSDKNVDDRSSREYPMSMMYNSNYNDWQQFPYNAGRVQRPIFGLGQQVLPPLTSSHGYSLDTMDQQMLYRDSQQQYYANNNSTNPSFHRHDNYNHIAQLPYYRHQKRRAASVVSQGGSNGMIPIKNHHYMDEMVSGAYERNTSGNRLSFVNNDSIDGSHIHPNAFLETDETTTHSDIAGVSGTRMIAYNFDNRCSHSAAAASSSVDYFGDYEIGDMNSSLLFSSPLPSSARKLPPQKLNSTISASIEQWAKQTNQTWNEQNDESLMFSPLGQGPSDE